MKIAICLLALGCTTPRPTGIDAGCVGEDCLPDDDGGPNHYFDAGRRVGECSSYPDSGIPPCSAGSLYFENSSPQTVIQLYGYPETTLIELWDLKTNHKALHVGRDGKIVLDEPTEPAAQALFDAYEKLWAQHHDQHEECQYLRRQIIRRDEALLRSLKDIGP